MARGDKYAPRVSFDISDELRNKLQDYIPWGTMRPLLTAMLEDVIRLIDETGFENRNIIIGAIVSKKITIVDIMKKFNKDNL